MTQRVRVLLQPAFILHHWPYRDTSVLLDVFTPDYGRVGLVARGARQPKSRSTGVLQAFHPLLVSWTGSGDLHTLSAAESSGAARWLTGAALMSGLYLNELLVRLLHRHDPHPELFADYQSVLTRLASPASPEAEPQLEMALRLFEKRLLAAIGYGLVLEHEAGSDAPIDAERIYAYHVGAGALPWQGDDEPADQAVLMHGSSLLALARDDLGDAQVLREAKRLMRAALAAQLGGKPLASRRLFAVPKKS